MDIDAAAPLEEALRRERLPEDGAVLEASASVADWETARALLLRAFHLTQEAARRAAPIVYVLHGEDLLGRRGAPSAMMATGLLSAARTAAIELGRQGVPVNVVAAGDRSDPAVVARWVSRLTERQGPTGQLLHLDPSHLGKALP